MIPVAAMAFARSWWKAGVGVVVGAVLAFPLGQCSGAGNQKKHDIADRLIAQTEALKTDGRAKEQASSERLQDAAKVADMTENLTDAVADLPDEVPSARRVRLGCEQLRLDPRTDLSNLPIACRPASGAQAPAVP